MTHYLYATKDGEIYKSPSMGKSVLYSKKPTPQHLAMMKHHTGGAVTQIIEVKIEVMK